MTIFRPNIDQMEGYAPGEQPQESGWVKLNTNENPYPPSPRVLEAIAAAARERLNIYPDPLGRSFCRAVGDLFGIDPEWILPANGSDENLTILMRSFVDPGELVTFPYPSYILYETLARIQGARYERLLLTPEWGWDLERVEQGLSGSKLMFLPNPNSPSGNRWSDETVQRLAPPRGLLVLDEAYADFADEADRLQLLRSDAGDRIIVTRSLSKSYSLAGLRFGFAIAHPDLIEGMRKVKDSYNCDALSLAAAEAAIRDQEWMLQNRKRVIATRTRLVAALHEMEFATVPSQANFVWATHPSRRHRELFQQLKAQRILVRYMSFPDAPGAAGEPGVDGLRITVGTDEQIDIFLDALRKLVSELE
jgi:histidinol-phosphate aminotransferase